MAQVEARGVWDAEVVGSSPITPTCAACILPLSGSSLVGKASAFQAEDREFESRLPLHDRGPIAQWLEPPAHNRLVPGSNPGGPILSAHFFH